MLAKLSPIVYAKIKLSECETPFLGHLWLSEEKKCNKFQTLKQTYLEKSPDCVTATDDIIADLSLFSNFEMCI